MTDTFGLVKVRDERAHQARLADASCQCEAQRREVALEIRDVRKLGTNRGECLCGILVLLQGEKVADAVENLQRLALRSAEAQAVGNGVTGLLHSAPPFVSVANRFGCAVRRRELLGCKGLLGVCWNNLERRARLLAGWRR